MSKSCKGLPHDPPAGTQPLATLSRVAAVTPCWPYESSCVLRAEQTRGRRRRGARAKTRHRQGEGRLQRHLRHRPARVLRRADLHSHRTPPADRPADAADPGSRILRCHHRRRGGRHRLRRGRPGGHHAAVPVRALRAVPGGQLQHLSADRIPRADVRRRDGRIHRRADRHAAPAARQRVTRTGRTGRTDVGGLPRRDARRAQRRGHLDGVRRGADRHRTVVRVARQGC